MGVFAAVASSLDGMSDTLERLFNFKVGHITRRLGPAENYLAFLHLPECEGSNPFPEAKTVEFRNVGFAYPNATKNAVSGLSLTIRDGGTVAVVGSNGAGKPTFTRLILGIYPRRAPPCFPGSSAEQTFREASGSVLPSPGGCTGAIT